MDAPDGPLSWYTQAGAAKPFADFYALDPSENPTVRPGSGAEPTPPDVRIAGESQLIVIARHKKPLFG